MTANTLYPWIWIIGLFFLMFSRYRLAAIATIVILLVTGFTYNYGGYWQYMRIVVEIVAMAMAILGIAQSNFLSRRLTTIVATLVGVLGYTLMAKAFIDGFYEGMMLHMSVPA